MANQHTILLIQTTGAQSSRTFSDYESVAQMAEAVCGMFEKRLKGLNPSMRSITYDINDLYTYINSLPDLSAMVFSASAWREQPYLRSHIRAAPGRCSRFASRGVLCNGLARAGEPARRSRKGCLRATRCPCALPISARVSVSQL